LPWVLRQSLQLLRGTLDCEASGRMQSIFLIAVNSGSTLAHDVGDNCDIRRICCENSGGGISRV
jgi:hypothetical protein